MVFLNPVFLFFIPFVLIPLIIHFLHFRKPESLAFSSIAFIEELQKTVVRKLRLKEWILLFVRTLAVVLALFVLAQPVFDSNSGFAQKDGEPICLIIDNSIGTDRVDANGPIIDQIKQLAVDFVEQKPEEQTWIILQTSEKPVMGLSVNKKEALKRILRIEALPQRSNLGALWSLLPDENASKFVVIGDNHIEKWKKSLAETKPRLQDQLDFLMIGNPSTQNVYISDVVLENQVVALNKPLQIRVDISASGTDRSVNQLVRLVLDDQVQGEYQLDLEPQSTKSSSFSINPNKVGFLQAYVELQGDAYLTDNRRYFVLKVPELRQIAVLADQLETDEDLLYIRAVLDASNASRSDVAFTYFSLAEINKLKAQEFSGYIFLGLKEIPEFLYGLSSEWLSDEKGLLVIPSTLSSIRSYNQFFAQIGLSLRYTGVQGSFSSPKIISTFGISDQAHPIYSSMFDTKKKETIRFESPNLFAFLGMSTNSSRFSLPILKTPTGEPIVLEERILRSKVLVSAIGPGSAWSNFASNSLFAPFWYKAAWYISVPTSGGIFQAELGTKVQERVLGSADELLFTNGSVYQEKPTVVKRGNRTVAELETWNSTSSILTLLQNKTPIFSTGLFLPKEDSFFRIAEKSEWEAFLSQHFGKVRVYELSNETRQTILSASSGSGMQIWPILAILVFLLLITESSISIWFKTN